MWKLSILTTVLSPSRRIFKLASFLTLLATLIFSFLMFRIRRETGLLWSFSYIIHKTYVTFCLGSNTGFGHTFLHIMDRCLSKFYKLSSVLSFVTFIIISFFTKTVSFLIPSKIKTFSMSSSTLLRLLFK